MFFYFAYMYLPYDTLLTQYKIINDRYTVIKPVLVNHLLVRHLIFNSELKDCRLDFMWRN